MQKINPFLWFDDNAEEAVNFYHAVFKNSKIGAISRYSDTGPGQPGSVMVATIEIEGTQFVLLNGGPMFKFNESVSFVIHTKDQAETDYYWNKLTEGGQESMCGWLKDKFGLSWQVTPDRLIDLISDPDPEKAGRAMKAMMGMQKIDIKGIEDAAEGE
jgi:predicted 3-demethylubiquinone-9 3-methyltransferase (glyoxalase superfamily)